MLIDTHCHLLDPAFEADRPEVIARARHAGVAHAVVVGETYDENQRILAAARRDPFWLPAAGHYPSHLDLDMATRTEQFIRDHHEHLAAIGEVGVDHRITDDPAERDIQDEILKRMASLSARFDLPLSVHSRSAGRHALALLRNTAATRVVMHAFDGKYGSAMAGVEAGYYFSIPPSIVRSRQKQKLARALPLERLLLESDAPVLGPDPSARNEPAHIRISANALAEIRDLSLEQVLETVEHNTRTLFGL